ncbi:hypothetical protein BG011_009299 [Mortierella polycephala]|uniref:Nodulin-like domain-containing protein n=1 Tax=Mortierella polycephala TaxID=41804 RepID=A0A9P6Q8P7_9FUNG|nr:hypothetical protein BG011_009299 [Mortierella polycephala]
MACELLARFCSHRVINGPVSSNPLKSSYTFPVDRTRTLRYVSLAIGLLVMVISGPLISFATFSTDLKARFGFTSSQTNLLSAVGDTSMFVGFLVVGPIYDHLGTRPTMMAASVLTCLGYGGMYFAYTKVWGGLGFLLLLFALVGIASRAAYLGALATNMTNFPSSSGTLSGVLLASFGFSTMLFSQIKTHFFVGEEEHAIRGTTATGHFLLFLAVITTVGYATAAILMVKVNDVSVGMDLDAKQVDDKDLHPHPASPTLVTVTPGLGFNPFLESIEMRPRQLLSEPVFWFFALALVLQQGFSYFNNIDSILQSVFIYPAGVSTTIFSAPSEDSAADSLIDITVLKDTHVTLVSLGNCIGRLSIGIISDYVISRYRVSRSILFVVSEILLLIPILIMSFASPALLSAGLLFFSSCMIGTTYGFTSALFASMAKDFFGNKYYGTCSGMVMVLVGFNPFIANLIYGVFYDHAIESYYETQAQASDSLISSMAIDIQHPPNDSFNMCLAGAHCYDTGFKVASVLQFASIVSAGTLFLVHMNNGKWMVQDHDDEEQRCSQKNLNSSEP